jgi:hypothetical protein
MVEDMEAHRASLKLAHGRQPNGYRFPISNTDISRVVPSMANSTVTTSAIRRRRTTFRGGR